MSNYLQSNYVIRFSDCDPFAHLNNARYLDYFLNAREDHLKTHYDLDLSSFYRKGIGWVIAQHEIAYLRPANLNEQVCIQSGLIDAGEDSLFLECVMFDEKLKQVKSVMHTRFIHVNLATGKKVAHEKEFQEFLVDKVVADTDGKTSLNERIEFWQEESRKVRKTESPNANQ